MVPPPPYIPAPHLIASSRLTAQELVSLFEGLLLICHSPLVLVQGHQDPKRILPLYPLPLLTSRSKDFSNTLRYVSSAPELVFERLVANVRNTVLETCMACASDDKIWFS